MSAVYKAQCKTFLIAQKLAGQFNNASSINDSLKPPYCLRVVKEYRTAAPAPMYESSRSFYAYRS